MSEVRAAGPPDGVLAATVDLIELGGRGVLVAGGYVLTAAHCVGWDGGGGMALGDKHLATVRTADGRSFGLSVCAADPVADVAVLGWPDGRYDGEEDFEAWVETTRPVPLYRGDAELLALDWEGVCLGDRPRDRPPVPCWVLNHDRSWFEATARTYSPEQPKVCFTSATCTRGGASGGPIVTTAGQLLGVVSWSDEPADGGTLDEYVGVGARPSKALPVWLVNAIQKAEQDSPPALAAAGRAD